MFYLACLMVFYLGVLLGFSLCILINKLLCYIEDRKAKKKESERHPEQTIIAWWDCTFYVEVATGKYYLARDLIKTYGRRGLFKLIAENKFVNEGHWKKKKERQK